MAYDYIRDISITVGDEDIELEVHFDADIDEDRIIVDSGKVYAYRLDNRAFFVMTEEERNSIVETLETDYRRSVIQQYRENMLDQYAADYWSDRR